MDRLSALLRLTRVEHSIMLVIAVVAAEIVAGYVPAVPILILSIITPIFVSMGSFAINDYYDVAADRANKRMDRPIVNGSITRKGALDVAIACFIIGVAASAFINAAAFVIALVFVVLAWLYSYKMKDMLLVGNLYIAFSMVIPFIYGNYVVSRTLPMNIVLISIIIFLAGLAREIHGMIRDYIGDQRARKSRNLVFHVGAQRSAELAFILYAEAIILSFYLFFFNAPFAFNLVYIAPIAVVDIALAYVAIGYLLSRKSKGFFRLSRNLSLAMMGLALVTFLAAALLFVRI